MVRLARRKCWRHVTMLFEGFPRNGRTGGMMADFGEQVIEFDCWQVVETGLDAQKDGRRVHVHYPWSGYKEEKEDAPRGARRIGSAQRAAPWLIGKHRLQACFSQHGLESGEQQFMDNVVARTGRCHGRVLRGGCLRQKACR